MIPASGLCTDCILLPLNQVPRQGINKQLECVVMVSWSFFTVGNTYVHLNQLGLEYLLKLLYLSSLWKWQVLLLLQYRFILEAYPEVSCIVASVSGD